MYSLNFSIKVQAVLANQECCSSRKVSGSGSLDGTYLLSDSSDYVRHCEEGCVYSKEDNPRLKYCFRDQLKTTELQEPIIECMDDNDK